MQFRKAFAVVALLALSVVIYATAESSDNTNVAVPTQNGTSANTSVTVRAQQLVGFYGNVSIQVRNNTAAGNILYNKNVGYGKLYFFKTGATPVAPFVAAGTNTNTNNNFSFTGYYNTSNHFDSQATVCGVASSNKLNTTDNRMTGIYLDSASAGAPNYFFCTDISSFTSTNGFGTIGYEIVVAKTASFLAYDIWYDLN